MAAWGGPLPRKTKTSALLDESVPENALSVAADKLRSREEQPTARRVFVSFPASSRPEAQAQLEEAIA
jgi:hypothetical protein